MAEKTLKVSITRTSFACSLHFVKGFSFFCCFSSESKSFFPCEVYSLLSWNGYWVNIFLSFCVRMWFISRSILLLYDHNKIVLYFFSLEVGRGGGRDILQAVYNDSVKSNGEEKIKRNWSVWTAATNNQTDSSTSLWWLQKLLLSIACP